MNLRPGHGILLLRDLTVDALVLDGYEIPDPKSVTDPRFSGSFRGFFDVPPGVHTVVGRIQGKEHAMTVTVMPGWATVKRFDMDAGWGDDDDATIQQYRSLALSGSMAQSGALRPWPLGLLFLRGKSENLQVDGHAVSASMIPFLAIKDVPPGKHTIAIGEKKLEVDVEKESVTVIDLDDGPTLANVKLAAIAVDLEALPAHSLVPHRLLGGEVPIHTFGDADFAWLNAAFEESNARQYLAALRWHYILDSEMGKQDAYFARLGVRLSAQVDARPSLVQGEAARYLGYFAQDLVDAESALTIPAGQALAEAIARAKTAAVRRPSLPPPAPEPEAAPAINVNKLFAYFIVALIFVVVFILAKR